MSSVTLGVVLTRLEQSHAQCARGQSCDRFADLQAMAPDAVEELIINDLKGSLERAKQAMLILNRTYCPEKPMLKAFDVALRHSDQDINLAAFLTLCQSLHSEDTELRRASAAALRWLQEEEAPEIYSTIIPMLNDPDEQVRASVKAALGRYQQPAVTALLAKMRQSIRNGDKLSLGDIKSLLNNMSPWATNWQQFLEAMEDEIPEVRRTVAAMLLTNFWHCPTPLAIFQSGLCHSDSEIRHLAAEKMTYHHDPVRVEVIINALRDRDPKVADALCTGKGYGFSWAIVPLSRLLGHESAGVRILAAMALMKIRPEFSELSRRMGVELVGFYKQLHVFRLVGILLLEDNSESSYGALAARMQKVFGESYNATTVRNYLRQTAELIEQYRILSGVREIPALDHERHSNGMGFFQSEQGSPFRFLTKGWECWGETMLYFALNEGRLADLPWVTSGRGH